MHRSKKHHEEKIIEVIKKNRIFSVLDIFAFYSGCVRSSFYEWGLDKSDKIKEAIDNNKVTTKQTLKSKWAKSDNATLQIALYKSICTEDERRYLNQSYVEQNTKSVEYSVSVTREEAKEIEKGLNEEY